MSENERERLKLDRERLKVDKRRSVNENKTSRKTASAALITAVATLFTAVAALVGSYLAPGKNDPSTVTQTTAVTLNVENKSEPKLGVAASVDDYDVTQSSRHAEPPGKLTYKKNTIVTTPTTRTNICRIRSQERAALKKLYSPTLGEALSKLREPQSVGGAVLTQHAAN